MNIFAVRHDKRARVGWIINNQYRTSRLVSHVSAHNGGVALARFQWLADYVNAHAAFGLRHEVYRPWRRYDALVFLKSMGESSMRLVRTARTQGTRVVFDANVNYYESSGTEYYAGMLPTAVQRQEAIEITRAADGVIADSAFLASVCAEYNPRVEWITDSVRMDLVPPYAAWRYTDGRLPLLWSGEAVKLFELLAIEEVLHRYAERIRLVLVTNSLDALARWHAGYRARFESLLAAVPHEIVPYRSIPQLFSVYARGGVCISPRFLDNSYNFGHTEWKITLAMACGRMALCSAVPSYEMAYERAVGRGIRICRSAEDWGRALDAILAGEIDMEAEGVAGRDVVARGYSTAVVAATHSRFMRGLIETGVAERREAGASPTCGGSCDKQHVL